MLNGVVTALKKEKEAANVQTCDFCGHAGVMGTEIVLEDYWDRISKHDTVKNGCRDKEACLKRQDENYLAWCTRH